MIASRSRVAALCSCAGPFTCKIDHGMYDADVFVLGGGPAGLAAAIAARRAGFSVVLADGNRPPIDKACGEGLMPDGLAAARELGIVFPDGCGGNIRGIKFQGDGYSVAGDFPDGYGLTIRRTTLQTVLVDRAQHAGVKLHWGSPVTAMSGNTVTLPGRQITARWLIGADGSQSSMRRWAGLDSFARDDQRFSYRQHFRIAPWSSFVEVYWGAGCQFYVSPTAEEEICVALLTRDPRWRVREWLHRVPELAARVASAQPASPERGRAIANRRLRRLTHGSIALIGDASGTIDPITGEGLCLAFRQAQALATAMVAGDLYLYERKHRVLARRPRFMADFMLLMDRSAFLRRRSLAALERRPELFRKLLAMHVGELRPVHFAKAATALGLAVIAS
ncbi:MAG TPA: FAD-dependent monooxygenase [Bryobacteraceae bacterium]|nr:FAD-dependent monooxygenase [Bryobacteraceae bacterium]